MKKQHKLEIFIGMAVLLAVLGAIKLNGYDPADAALARVSAKPRHWAGPFGVNIALEPEKPKVGHNAMTLSIQDKDHNPITDARIEAVAEMPAMGSMPAMPVPIEMTMDSPGRYRGKFELSMEGYWPLSLSIQSAAYGTARLMFDMSTGRKGLELTSATPGDKAKSNALAVQTSSRPVPFTVDAYRRQLIGVTTGLVRYRQLIKTIRSPAQIAYDETGLTDVRLKFDGWIGELHADYIGKPVSKGQTLFTVYNPKLVSTQEEYLDSLKTKDRRLNNLARAAHRRLTLMGIDAEQIRALARQGRASEYIPMLSPVSGVVIDKHIVAGTAVKAGMPLLRIADLSNVWVDARIYESELPWIEPGIRAEVELEDSPDSRFRGTIDFIEPALDRETRSVKVRMVLPNIDGELRPDRYARMKIRIDLGNRLSVPEQAVIYAGENRVVFLDLGDGRLLPKKIKTGLRNNDFIEVLDGLAEGDKIVTSGHFLIASESKLKSGLEQW